MFFIGAIVLSNKDRAEFFDCHLGQNALIGGGDNYRTITSLSSLFMGRKGQLNLHFCLEFVWVFEVEVMLFTYIMSISQLLKPSIRGTYKKMVKDWTAMKRVWFVHQHTLCGNLNQASVRFVVKRNRYCVGSIILCSRWPFSDCVMYLELMAIIRTVLF